HRRGEREGLSRRAQPCRAEQAGHRSDGVVDLTLELAMTEPAVPVAHGRKDVIWREDSAVTNYLTTSRQAIPLAAEQMDAMLRALAAFGCPTRTVLDLGAGDGAAAVAV